MQDFFTLMSLLISVPTIFFSIAVVIIWRKEAVKFLKNKDDATSWLILGIWISFLGFTLDNLYWDLAWTYGYIYPEKTNLFFIYGSFPNIFFRQLMGLLGGYCHIKAYIIQRNTDDYRIPVLFALGTIVGLTYVTCLFFGVS